MKPVSIDLHIEELIVPSQYSMDAEAFTDALRSRLLRALKSAPSAELLLQDSDVLHAASVSLEQTPQGNGQRVAQAIAGALSERLPSRPSLRFGH